MKKTEKAAIILKELKKRTPEMYCALTFKNPYELVVATILSAQCTDKRVNMVTPALFKAFPTVQHMAEAPLEKIEELVRSTGFYRNKAKNIKGLALKVVVEFKGEIPKTMEELITLPGVARKTANVVLTHGYGIIDGVCVDTHVLRIGERLGLTKGKNAVIVEKALMKLYPKEEWGLVTTCFIDLGRTICDARKPQCSACPLTELCVYYKKLQKH